jgi:hypothetical protein
MNACQKMKIESLHSYLAYNQTFRSSMMSLSTLTHLNCLFKIGHICKKKNQNENLTKLEPSGNGKFIELMT